MTAAVPSAAGRAPSSHAVLELRARVHRRMGIEPPAGVVTMAVAAGLGYELAGPADGEAVLFLHAGTATSFTPLMTQRALADRHRLVRYHRRGYFCSDALEGDMSVEAHVADALRLLDQLGIDRVHVVGHSGSGVIAIQLALDAPGVVRSLVLEEPAIHAIDHRWQRVMLATARRWSKCTGPANLDAAWSGGCEASASSGALS